MACPPRALKLVSILNVPQKYYYYYCGFYCGDIDLIRLILILSKKPRSFDQQLAMKICDHSRKTRTKPKFQNFLRHSCFGNKRGNDEKVENGFNLLRGIRQN